MKNGRRSAMSFLMLILVVATGSAVAQTPLLFTPINPCRVVDTRTDAGPLGGPAIQAGTFRSFPLTQGTCNIPSTAWGYSLNLTVVPSGPLGYATVWPANESKPVVSTLNSPDGRVKASAATILASAPGTAVSVFATDNTDVVLDINGYYSPMPDSNLAFYPLPPCRLVDTRNPDGSLGGPMLLPGQERDFPIVEAPGCNVPANAVAYSLNITAVPQTTLSYLTVWPTGQVQPLVSTLNVPTGTVTANAAIVEAGTGGNISVFPTDTTDLVIDINGYFAPAGTGGLSLYAVTPCRVLDTRGSTGPFTGELMVNVVGSVCAPPSNAQGYLMSATVVPPSDLTYLTLWADGAIQPLVSTLNAQDGMITSNMAIVPTTNGSISAFAAGGTDLLLDIFGYLAP